MHYIAPPDANGCMCWTGTLNGLQQGVFLAAVNPQGRLGNMSCRVYLWWKLHGEVPPGRLITTCHNPSCLTPAHLALRVAAGAKQEEQGHRAAWDALVASETRLREFMADRGAAFHVAIEYGLTRKQVEQLRGEYGKNRLAELSPTQPVPTDEDTAPEEPVSTFTPDPLPTRRAWVDPPPLVLDLPPSLPLSVTMAPEPARELTPEELAYYRAQAAARVSGGLT
jgi:hypothetical protein